MPTIDVSLTDDLAEFIAEQVLDGAFNDPSEVVCDSLRQMRERKAKVRDLREAVRKGIDGVRAGHTKPFTDALLRDIAERGRKRARRKRRN